MAGKVKLHFDDLLLRFIRTAQNEQFKTLSKVLIRNSVHWKTLLHHAALCDNHVIARYLIDMGLDVNGLDSDSKTPLMVAVQMCNATVVEVLLEANADIHITNAAGESVLRMIFHSEYFSTKILKVILQRLILDCFSINELLDRLIGSGCSMYHVTFLRNIEIMQMLMDRGIDINSKGYFKDTALHAAVEMNDLNILEWILDKGGDVEAANEYSKVALYDAATDGKVDLVRLLLEHGANPNTRNAYTGYTPLFAVFLSSLHVPNQDSYDECAELLLQHGAIPDNNNVDHNTLFDYALLNCALNKKTKSMVCQLAVLDKLGKCSAKSVMVFRFKEHSSILLELIEFYESCRNLLGFIVYGHLSLFNLLTHNESKMRTYARNKQILSKIDTLYPVIDEVCPYYSRFLKKRLLKAVDVVKLEDAAIPVFSKLVNANYNLYYDLVREIIGNLSERDLKQLCQV
ncbi:ankyrin-1-like [Phymastichus coffea]|uniref:ankyrin-1-like n=1 Tax=Phymastichus coffea TaxID=108790 RepID=UPI00273B6EFC|nr:ankyrin-1-like [Phymastichus coffea]